MAAFVSAMLGLFITISIQHAMGGSYNQELSKGAAATFFVGAYISVYKYFQKQKKKEARILDPNAPTITKGDYKNFQKILATIDCGRMGITEFRAIERMDNSTGFFIGLRAEKGKVIDTDLLRQALYAVFNAQNSFEFVDLESERGKQWFANSVAVKIPEGGRT